MTNKEIESYRNSYKVVNGIGFCRVNNDINGNERVGKVNDSRIKEDGYRKERGRQKG